MSAGITSWGTCNKTVIKTLETTQKKEEKKAPGLHIPFINIIFYV